MLAVCSETPRADLTPGETERPMREGGWSESARVVRGGVALVPARVCEGAYEVVFVFVWVGGLHGCV